MTSLKPVRIANISGFYGDDPTAFATMLDGDPVDYITGDYLAELTMLILAKDMMKNPNGGWAKTFLAAVKENAAQLAKSGTKVVVNAGGLNPKGLSDALTATLAEQDIDLTVGWVDGDNMAEKVNELGIDGAICANAYLGAWGIVECLDAGADIVVTGRVTDASLVVGPAAHHYGWSRDDLDRIAGAMAAGHVIECGTQATGGNYAFFNRGEIADPLRPGYPIAEVNEDGTSVITKKSGTGGAVTEGTVTAQLLYEVTGARYPGPDSTLRLDHVRVEQDGKDRVRITGATGEAPPPTTKVGVNTLGGYRNEFHVYLTGLDIEDKAALFQRQFEALPSVPETVEFRLARTDHPDPATQAEGTARLIVVGWDMSQSVIDEWSRTAIGLALSTFPGAFFDGRPPRASMYGTFVPAYVDNSIPSHTAHLPDGTEVAIDAPATTTEVGDPFTDLALPEFSIVELGDVEDGDVVKQPLGLLAAARSGDKGGNANIGVWVENADAYPWLLGVLTESNIRELLPETRDLAIHMYPLPRLNAVNIVIEGILGHGVAHGARFDAQAKGLGEWLRARYVPVPKNLLPQATHGIDEKDNA